MTNQGGGVMGQDAAGTAALAQDQARDVAGTALEQAKGVAASVGEQAGSLRVEAAEQARGVVDDARAQVREQVEARTRDVAQALGRVRGQLEALSQGRALEAGPFAAYSRQATGWVGRMADRVSERGFEGLVRDVERYARRRPGVFLAAAAGGGFVAGRLLRAQRDGGSDRSEEHSGGPPGSDVPTGAVGGATTPWAAEGEPTSTATGGPTGVPATGRASDRPCGRCPRYGRERGPVWVSRSRPRVGT